MAERPSRWGGAWGIGCAVCAGLQDRAETTPTSTAHGSARASTPGKHVRARCGTKWARYEVRSSHLQSEHIFQHTLTDAHKIAAMAHCAPDRPVVVALQRSLDDDQLLSGAVPQPKELRNEVKRLQKKVDERRHEMRHRQMSPDEEASLAEQEARPDEASRLASAASVASSHEPGRPAQTPTAPPPSYSPLPACGLARAKQQHGKCMVNDW